MYNQHEEITNSKRVSMILWKLESKLLPTPKAITHSFFIILIIKPFISKEEWTRCE